MRLVYTAEHVSLAILEYFVHIDSDDPPGDLVLVRAEVPDSVSRISLPRRQLPRTWRTTPAPPDLAEIGNDFVARRASAILIVPSALAPTEANWLINPRHPEFGKIRTKRPEAFHYDPRFFRR